MAAPDADEWKEAVDREKKNLKSHDVYELLPRTNDTRTLKLGWTGSSKAAFSRGTRKD